MSTDWRARCLELEQQTESERRSRDKAERELTRLVTRLCVACSGLDPQMDPPLERLRKVARKGKADELLRQSEAFADAIVHAADDRVSPGVLAHLLQRAGQPQKQVEATLKLWAEVATDPGAASDDKLDELARMMQVVTEVSGASAVAAQPAATGGRPGLFRRLIGRPSADQGQSPNRQLLELIEAVDWPEELLAQIDDFRERIEADGGGGVWIEVVQEIGELAARALTLAQANARSTETFLTELNQRLEELDRHMLDEGQRSEDARESGVRLGRQVDSEVVTLTESLRSSTNMEELQASVIGSLDRIHSHVRQHLDEESQRRESAEIEAGRLRQQMSRVEQDSYDLRRQVAQTYQAAMRDPLTGMPNRRAYEEQLAQEFARWKRFEEPLAMLVLDVDDFKKVNDEFGHKSGDKALLMISRVLGERRRATDIVARYGGEEFVVLLPGADKDDALRIANDMRSAVADCGLHANKQPVTITVSGGLSMFVAGDDPDRVFERADKALYQAKRNGKNRIELAVNGE